MTTVNAMSDANPSSFTGMMIGVLATIIITIVLVQVVGCDEKESQKNDMHLTKEKEYAS